MNKTERHEADIKRMIDGIDIESLQVLSIGELQMRNSLIHKIVQEAIITQDPRKEGLIAQQRAINSVLVGKIRDGGKNPAPVRVGMDSVNFKLDGKI